MAVYAVFVSVVVPAELGIGVRQIMRKLKVFSVFSEVLPAMLHSKNLFECILDSVQMFYYFKFLCFHLNFYFSKHLKRKAHNCLIYLYFHFIFLRNSTRN